MQNLPFSPSESELKNCGIIIYSWQIDTKYIVTSSAYFIMFENGLKINFNIFIDYLTTSQNICDNLTIYLRKTRYLKNGIIYVYITDFQRFINVIFCITVGSEMKRESQNCRKLPKCQRL